jgi:tripartite-type tricarboxylate transporter receptor subunit TctC
VQSASTSFRDARALAALLLAITLVQSAAHAQDAPSGYPARPVRVITASVPGGGLDILSRVVAQSLTDRFGQAFIVDNRPGASGVLATELTAKSTPDGHTLAALSEALRIHSIIKRLPFDIRKAFEPVALISSQPYILIIAPTLPVKNVKELFAYANTQRLTYGSSGIGTIGHLGLESLFAKGGGQFIHVPYKGGAQSIVALLAGEIQLYPGLLLSANPAIRSGKARVLAVLDVKRLPALPDVPTVAEQSFPGFKITNSYAIYAPAGTPRAIINVLNRAVSDFVNSPQMAQRLVAEGSQPGERLLPEELKVQFNREYDELERQVKSLKIKIF